jgi:DNA-binding protein H-NS
MMWYKVATQQFEADQQEKEDLAAQLAALQQEKGDLQAAQLAAYTAAQLDGLNSLKEMAAGMASVGGAARPRALEGAAWGAGATWGGAGPRPCGVALGRELFLSRG